MEALAGVTGLDQDRLPAHAHYAMFHDTGYGFLRVADIDTTETTAAVILAPDVAPHDGSPAAGVANEIQNLWLTKNPLSFTWNLVAQPAEPDVQTDPQPPYSPGDPVAVLYDSHIPHKTRVRMKVDSRYQPYITLKRAW